MRDAVRNKERRKRRRTPTQDPSTDLAHSQRECAMCMSQPRFFLNAMRGYSALTHTRHCTRRIPGVPGSAKRRFFTVVMMCPHGRKKILGVTLEMGSGREHLVQTPCCSASTTPRSCCSASTPHSSHRWHCQLSPGLSIPLLATAWPDPIIPRAALDPDGILESSHLVC